MKPPVHIYLDHLLGATRGTRQELEGHSVQIGSGEDAVVHFPAHLEPDVARYHATLTRRGDGYLLTAGAEALVFVNGSRIESVSLEAGDLIRIGTNGPLLRYRIDSQTPRAGNARHKSMRDIFDDCRESARASSESRMKRGLVVLGNLPKDVMTQASPITRWISIASFIVLLAVLGFTGTRLMSLESRLQAQSDALNETLGLFQDRSELKVEDVRALREELESASSRLSELENRTNDGAAVVATVVAAAARAVIFIQGGYGFRKENGAFLRATVGVDGRILRDTKGLPVPTFKGEGPIYEQQFTGTAFIVSKDGLLLTNHHVAEPWAFDPGSTQAIANGLSPVMIRMIGFLPGHAESFDIEPVAIGQEADLALMQSNGDTSDFKPLLLADHEPDLGQSVMVLGYPTGMRALLARADRAFVDSLLSVRPQPDFWKLASRLAAGGYVTPLVTRGIVGQITGSHIVYDAETTHGGSGGPVIGLDGLVYAVNAAIVNDFGGSNLGVPSRDAKRLMKRAASIPEDN